MTRRSPRTGESSHEWPRPARKERDTLGGTSHHAATMLVHFRETPYGLAMSLVETRRENGKVRHEHVASLGSIETPPSVAASMAIRSTHQPHGNAECLGGLEVQEQLNFRSLLDRRGLTPAR